MFKSLIKKITNKKFLITIAVIAIIAGGCMYYKNQIMSMAQDVDAEITKTEDKIARAVMDLTPNKVSEETKDLSQSPQPMPGIEQQENFAPIA